jgi:hypothetical protein
MVIIALNINPLESRVTKGTTEEATASVHLRSISSTPLGLAEGKAKR